MEEPKTGPASKATSVTTRAKVGGAENKARGPTLEVLEANIKTAGNSYREAMAAGTAQVLLTPLIEKVKPTGTSSTTSSEEGEEDQEMEDALEDAPVSFATSMGSKSAVAATVLASSVAVAVSMSLCDNMAELCEHQ